MAVKMKSPVSGTEDREIVISRLFDAPPYVVFQAWLTPAAIGAWWGPRGFTTTTHSMDVRPGGVWTFIMHGPDGTDYPNRVVYREVVEGVRLAYVHGSGTDHGVRDFEVVVTFEEEAGKTRLTMRSLFQTAAIREQMVREVGAIEGGNQTLERLAEELSAQGPGVHQPDLVFTRVLDAPRELVYKAWTEGDRLQRWWGPRGFTNPVCRVDARPGGKLYLEMRAPDGTIYPTGGEFHELVPPLRIVFTSTALDDAGKVLLAVRNEVTLDNQDGMTKLTLRVRLVKASPEAASYLAGMEQGWSECLERLAEDVKVDPVEFSLTREFDAPLELVWKAYTEAERLAKWWGPKGFKLMVARFELRPGGMFLYRMTAANGFEMWGRFIYREIVPQERMVFVSSFTDAEGNNVRHPMSATWPLEMLNSMTLTESGGKTTIHMTSVPVNATEEERATFLGGHASMVQGYKGTLDQLEEFLKEG